MPLPSLRRARSTPMSRPPPPEQSERVEESTLRDNQPAKFLHSQRGDDEATKHSHDSRSVRAVVRHSHGCWSGVLPASKMASSRSFGYGPLLPANVSRPFRKRTSALL